MPIDKNLYNSIAHKNMLRRKGIPFRNIEIDESEEILFPYDGSSMYKGGYQDNVAAEIYEPDETGHLPSIDYRTGIWLKDRNHPTSWMELQGTLLNLDLYKKIGHPILNEEGRLQYRYGYGDAPRYPSPLKNSTQKDIGLANQAEVAKAVRRLAEKKYLRHPLEAEDRAYRKALGIYEKNKDLLYLRYVWNQGKESRQVGAIVGGVGAGIVGVSLFLNKYISMPNIFGGEIEDDVQAFEADRVNKYDYSIDKVAYELMASGVLNEDSVYQSLLEEDRKHSPRYDVAMRFEGEVLIPITDIREDIERLYGKISDEDFTKILNSHYRSDNIEISQDGNTVRFKGNSGSLSYKYILDVADNIYREQEINYWVKKFGHIKGFKEAITHDYHHDKYFNFRNFEDREVLRSDKYLQLDNYKSHKFMDQIIKEDPRWMLSEEVKKLLEEKERKRKR